MLTNRSRVWLVNHLYQHVVFSRVRALGQNIRYSGVNCALGPSKSILYIGDFVIAGSVIAGFVSTYFTVILLGFQMWFVITGSSLLGSTVVDTTSSD